MKSENKIQYIPLSETMVKHATDRLYSLKFGGKRTRLTEKTKRIRETGYIGEEIIKKAYPFLEYSQNWRYDFTYNGLTFDAKAVGCNGEPQLDYVGAVFDKPEADILIFTRILNDRTGGWICGAIQTKEFFKIAEKIKANTVNNNFTYDHDRLCIPYGKLSPLELLLNLSSKSG